MRVAPLRPGAEYILIGSTGRAVARGRADEVLAALRDRLAGDPGASFQVADRPGVGPLTESALRFLAAREAAAGEGWEA